MMLLPNFNSIDPSIAWYKSEPSDQETTPLIRFYNYLKKNPRLAIPPLAALSIVATLGVVNIVVQSSISALATNHDEFSNLRDQLSIVNSTKSRLVGELQEVKDFLVQSIHSFVFARLLQELVPLDVQLKDYSLSTSGISLEASSYSQQSINDFIVFFSAHPLIQQDSVKVADLSATTAPTDPQATATRATQQPRQIYILRVTAMYQNPNNTELYKLMAKAGNTGLLVKLREISPQAQP